MRSVFFVLCLFSFLAAARGQHVKTIELNNGSMNYTAKQFYIKEVVDDRDKKESSGWMGEDKLEFNNGAAASFKTVLDNSVKQDRAAQPIILHITRLYCEITRKGGQWEINAEAGFAFYSGNLKLVEFTGTGDAHTGNDPVGYLATIINKSFKNDLEKFDTWWAENKGHVAVSPEVRVNVTLSKTSDKPGKIVYTARRPLTINDFHGPVGDNPAEAAVTMSGIGIRYNAETENSHLVLNITIYPNFDINESWFRNTEQNQKVLAHEQTHFDITALYACKLASTLSNTHFTKENYSRLIEEIQKQNAEASQKEEIIYDDETRHGTIRDKQEEWQKRLKEAVRSCGCY